MQVSVQQLTTIHSSISSWDKLTNCKNWGVPILHWNWYTNTKILNQICTSIPIQVECALSLAFNFNSQYHSFNEQIDRFVLRFCRWKKRILYLTDAILYPNIYLFYTNFLTIIVFIYKIILVHLELIHQIKLNVFSNHKIVYD